MKKLVSVLIIVSLLLSIYSAVFAQEVSSTWMVRVYQDVNNNGVPDNGEEVFGETIKFGIVNDTICSSVDDNATFDNSGAAFSPLVVLGNLSCHFFLVGKGELSVTNYSAKRTSIQGQSPTPDLWIKLPCKTCKAFLPVVLRAWSGVNQ